MANTLRLEIVTPEATAYSEDVDMVTLPGVEGQMGVLPLHVRLMTQLVPGELIVRKGGHDDFLAVGEGLIEVTNDRVSILTNMAVAVENIDEAAVRSTNFVELGTDKDLLNQERELKPTAARTRNCEHWRATRKTGVSGGCFRCPVPGLFWPVFLGFLRQVSTVLNLLTVASRFRSPILLPLVYSSFLLSSERLIMTRRTLFQNWTSLDLP